MNSVTTQSDFKMKSLLVSNKENVTYMTKQLKSIKCCDQTKYDIYNLTMFLKGSTAKYFFYTSHGICLWLRVTILNNSLPL